MTTTLNPSQQRPATKAVVNRVAVVLWKPQDGMGQAVSEALGQLGYDVAPFEWNQALPERADVVFSQGPYGRFLNVPSRLGQLPAAERPLLVHWNDEGLPDLRLPWPIMAGLGGARSWIGRLVDSPNPTAQSLARLPPVKWIDRRMMRFSYLGDYHYAHKRGWLSLLVDQSKIYAALHSTHGLPALAVPWGAIPAWSADLGLERDIDVLWMGARASRRRGALLDRVQGDLRRRGIEMYVADNEQHPFIFGDERTRMLNRAKVTLNLTRTWYDDNFLRFSIVMPNRSLVVSEPMLAHCAEVVAGKHYVSASIDQLAEKVEFYLLHADERERIVDDAYALATNELTLKNCVARIMAAVTQLNRARQVEGRRPA